MLRYQGKLHWEIGLAVCSEADRQLFEVASACFSNISVAKLIERNASRFCANRNVHSLLETVALQYRRIVRKRLLFSFKDC